MPGGINFESASALREILVRNISLSQAEEDAKSVLNINKISISADVSSRISQTLSKTPKTDDPIVIRELTKLYNTALSRPTSFPGLVKAPNRVAEVLSVPLSSATKNFLQQVPFEDMLDSSAHPDLFEGPLTTIPDNPPLAQDDGIPWPLVPRPSQGGGPIPRLDPLDPHAGRGIASLVIIVAIGIILLANKERTIEDPVIDFSGLKKL